jgi:hypothetical protein
MIGFFSWRGVPRQDAPIVAGALHPLLIVSAIAMTLLALYRTATAGDSLSRPEFAIAAVACVVLAGILVIVATDPARPPSGRVAFGVAVAAAVTADVLSALSGWGASAVLWSAWEPLVVGLVILCFSMFRAGRELAVATVLAAAVVGGTSALEAPHLPDLVSPITAAVISATPVVLFGVLASVFSYRMSLALARRAEAAARAEQGLARRVRIRVRELLRESGRAGLSAELVPFFTRVLESGAVTDADVGEARRLSAVLRSEILATAGLPWLARLVRAHPRRLIVHDGVDLSETLAVEQKVALRALLTTLMANDDVRGAMEVRLTDVGGHRSVFVLVPWSGSEAAGRRALGGLLTVMGAAYGRAQVTVADGALRLLFADRRRPR